MEVSTISVSGWVKDAPLLSEVSSWFHPLTWMVLTRLTAAGSEKTAPKPP